MVFAFPCFATLFSFFFLFLFFPCACVHNAGQATYIKEAHNPGVVQGGVNIVLTGGMSHIIIFARSLPLRIQLMDFAGHVGLGFQIKRLQYQQQNDTFIRTSTHVKVPIRANTTRKPSQLWGTIHTLYTSENPPFPNMLSNT